MQQMSGESQPSINRHETRESYADAVESCVYVSVWRNGQMVGQGTGFLAHKENGEGIIVTASHVLMVGYGSESGQPNREARGETVMVQFLRSGTSYTATPVGLVSGSSDRADIATLLIKGAIAEEPFELATGAGVGTSVRAIGAVPRAEAPLTKFDVHDTTGEIIDVPRTDDELIATSIPAKLGYGGGPLLTEDGRVVGVVTQIIPDQEALVVPAEDVEDLIEGTLELVGALRGSVAHSPPPQHQHYSDARYQSPAPQRSRASTRESAALPQLRLEEGKSERHPKPLEACVRMSYTDPYGRIMTTGAGFLVYSDGRQGLVLTAAHNIEQGWERGFRGAPPEERTPHGTDYHVEFLLTGKKCRANVILQESGTSMDSDMVLVAVEGDLPVRPLYFGSAVELGEAVEAMGTGAGRNAKRLPTTLQAKGKVTAYPQGDNDLLHTTAQVQPGFSGGPLLNSKGQLAGMTVRMDPTTGHAMAIPAENLQMFLKQAYDVIREDPSLLTVPERVPGGMQIRLG